MSPDLCKIIVVGEKSTGKSSLINRYVTNSFQLKMRTTVGCDFSLKEHIQVDALPPITLQIWDISGQERFGQLTRVYYQMALGALVAYDVTNPESYEVDALPPITLQIWDISGQERFGQLTRVYYQMALARACLLHSPPDTHHINVTTCPTPSPPCPYSPIWTMPEFANLTLTLHLLHPPQSVLRMTEHAEFDSDHATTHRLTHARNCFTTPQPNKTPPF
eukprot:NODE_4123_length_838_cov_14.315049_g3965_i0.p1 GENE.NODE_4123_length_838_cov_14.315049_g3965_i0~~NODE_4123_length_838_cov_14.315049_g3965_i0.p1  ORF type:complete len:220 (+),score=32.25 NODE_4123_length_838_cov_14.315049_g3965_i0:80-739(+)